MRNANLLKKNLGPKNILPIFALKQDVTWGYVVSSSYSFSTGGAARALPIFFIFSLEMSIFFLYYDNIKHAA